MFAQFLDHETVATRRLYYIQRDKALQDINTIMKNRIASVKNVLFI